MTRQTSVNLQDIIASIKQNHSLPSNAQKNFQSAYNLLSDEIVVQSLSVALFIAKWGFNYDVVLAALLHKVRRDTISNSALILNSTSQAILDGFDNITMQLCTFEKSHSDETANPIDMVLNNPVPESLYIKIAERIDLLSSDSLLTDIQKKEYAQSTRKILLPQITYIGAFRLVNILEDLCLQIENPSVYKCISQKIRSNKLYNTYYQSTITKRLQHLFDANSRMVSGKLSEHQKYIKDFFFSPRSVSSIYRALQQQNMTEIDFQEYIGKSNIAFLDLTLIIDDYISDDSVITPIDIFMEYYNEHLKKQNISIINYYKTTQSHSEYFLLCDYMHNLYRFFIRTESQYLHYLFGNIVNREKIDFDTNGNTKIKVYKKDGTVSKIEADSTVLDFAFMIHSELGLHFKHALLNNDSQFYPAYTKLKPGDTVTIVTSEDYTAELQWFRHVKTNNATNHLIKYFNQIIENTGFKNSDS